MKLNSKDGFTTPSIGTFLSGKALDDLLLAGIEEKKKELITHISSYDGRDLFPKWLELIRCIDELVNLRYVFPPAIWETASNICIDLLEDDEGVFVYYLFGSLFGEDVCCRMMKLIHMLLRIKTKSKSMGITDMDFRSIGETVDFLQARRLYYVTYLTLIRLYAKGSRRIPFAELLCNFQYQIDFNMRPITTALHAIIESSNIEGFGATVRDFGLEFTKPYKQLDDFFLEPQVMNELDILEYERIGDVSLSGHRLPPSLYSYEELQYTITQVEKVFGVFGVSSSLVLSDAKRMVDDLKETVVDGYSVVMSEEEFKAFSLNYPHLILDSIATDYFEALNERPAFFRFNDHYYSNVLLIIRFIENTFYGLLRRNRRFRIKAGFVFEKKVKALLEEYGFDSTETKRIHHQEFDVICLKDGRAYNFQCKNNFLDINALNTHNIVRISRQNKKLVKYYVKALEKENLRTKLVQEYFGVNCVENYVVTRFPVVMEHERLIPFNQLEDWLKKNKVG